MVECHQRLQPPLQEGIDHVVVMPDSLRVRFGSLALRVDPAPRERKPEALESRSLREVGVLLIPAATPRVRSDNRAGNERSHLFLPTNGGGARVEVSLCIVCETAASKSPRIPPKREQMVFKDGRRLRLWRRALGHHRATTFYAWARVFLSGSGGRRFSFSLVKNAVVE